VDPSRPSGQKRSRPTSDETIPGLLRRRALESPDGAATWDGEAPSLAELDEAVDRVAASLLASGIGAQERVAVWAPNSERWATFQLAALRVGAIVVPLNTRFTGAEAAALLARAPCKLLAVDTEFRGVDLLEELRDSGGREHAGDVAIIGGPVADDAVSWEQLLVRADSINPREIGEREAAITGDWISHLQFTSGTTGRPKGALLAHRAMVNTTAEWCKVTGLDATDRYVITSPLFHLAGHKTGVLASLTSGAAFSFEPTVDIGRLLGRITAERISVLQGPPTLFADLMEHPARPRHDLSSLRLAVTGAAVIPEQLIRRMQGELDLETVITAYGATETTGVITMCRPTDPPEVISATSGRPIPGVEVRIQTENNPATGRAEGEILVRGDGVFAGYLDDPQATEAVVDTDGWYHTGDIGWFDDGNLRITDRLSDMVLVGGFNVYPAEVEATMRDHPGIGDVAVIGLPDARLGEVPVAFLVARSGVTLELDEILEWCRSHLASHKRPRHVHVVESLPRTASGKVRKVELRDEVDRWM
jgi:acyl-CoA synthetase (AMP-forming)/AMP-acid ligase II